MIKNVSNTFFTVNLAPVKFHLMDKLFWAGDQKEVAKWQQFDKGMRKYCSQKDLGAVF